MTNATLILAATIWRLASYVFRAAVLGVSIIYGGSMLHSGLLIASVVVFSLLLVTTLRISELNAMAQPAPDYLLNICNLLDIMLWIFTVFTLSAGVFHVAGI